MKMTALRAAVLGALALGQTPSVSWAADAASKQEGDLGEIVVTGQGEQHQQRHPHRDAPAGIAAVGAGSLAPVDR